MIGACHALVKRLQHEALGLIPPLQGSSVQLPILDRPLRLDMVPSFADDSLIAGLSAGALRALRRLKAVMPDLGVCFSTLQVAPAAGTNSTVD